MNVTVTPRPDAEPPAIAGLELGMQELEAMEAPGFWTGFETGIEISLIGVATAGIAVAIT